MVKSNKVEWELWNVVRKLTGGLARSGENGSSLNLKPGSPGGGGGRQNKGGQLWDGVFPCPVMC